MKGGRCSCLICIFQTFLLHFFFALVDFLQNLVVYKDIIPAV